MVRRTPFRGHIEAILSAGGDAMHTIEAALCTGITLVLIVQIVLLGQAAYLQTKDDAEREAASSVHRVTLSALYEVTVPEGGEPVMPTVRTSPVKLLRVASAAKEALAPVASWLRQVLRPQG